jgi:hypothetical protein
VGIVDGVKDIRSLEVTPGPTAGIDGTPGVCALKVRR